MKEIITVLIDQETVEKRIRELAAQISRRAAEVLDQAGQGISEEMRENMYQCLDSIALRMREICES